MLISSDPHARSLRPCRSPPTWSALCDFQMLIRTSLMMFVSSWDATMRAFRSCESRTNGFAPNPEPHHRLLDRNGVPRRAVRDRAAGPRMPSLPPAVCQIVDSPFCHLPISSKAPRFSGEQSGKTARIADGQPQRKLRASAPADRMLALSLRKSVSGLTRMDAEARVAAREGARLEFTRRSIQEGTVKRRRHAEVEVKCRSCQRMENSSANR
jgi:hypothetical protein